jgi:hypothetical protein
LITASCPKTWRSAAVAFREVGVVEVREVLRGWLEGAGYHTATRGQSRTTHAPVVLRTAPRLPCGRAGTVDEMPHSPSVQDLVIRPPLLTSLVEKAPDKEKKVLASGHSRSRSANDEHLAYISCYINGYGRP